MKKHLFALTALTLLTCTLISAQSTKPGKFTINAGVGVVSTFVSDHGKSNVLPLSLKVGYDVSRNFNLSLTTAYSSTTTKPKYFADGIGSSVTNKQSVFALRGEYRSAMTERFNFYGGAMLGYAHNDVKEYNAATGALMIRHPEEPTPFNPEAKKGQLFYSGFVGMDVQLQKHIGVFAEAGYGVALLTTGLSLRF